MIWNNALPDYYSIYPFAIYEWSQFTPPYPIPTVFSQHIRLSTKIQDPVIIPETPCRQTQADNEEKSSGVLGFRKQKKQEKNRTIKKKQKQQNFEKKKQKKDRNLPSNICRFFVSFLYQHPCPQRILGSCPSETVAAVRSCINQMRGHIRENQTYVRPCLIESMCKGKMLGERQSSIFRMFFKRFVKVELRMVISMMHKLKKKEKVAYFKFANRFLRQFTSQI